MAEVQSSFTPRFLTYCCTHWWDQSRGPYIKDLDRWLSMLRLTEPGQKVTHINLGQWWWAPKRSEQTLFLNDTAWTEPETTSSNEVNDRIFAEVKQLQKKGIKVLTQLTYFWGSDGFGRDGAFNESLYALVKAMLTRAGFDGVDLDVEDFATDNAKVTRFIKRLRQDFGPGFLITMAPGGRELLAQDAPNYGQLSSIVYKTLYEDIGHEINWFNLQCYNSWGRLELAEFERFVKAGTDKAVYPVDKIVMSVASNWKDASSHDWTDGATIQKNLPEILAKYPNMGGFCCWEWYNAVLPADWNSKTPVLHPEEWFKFVYKILRGTHS